MKTEIAVAVRNAGSRKFRGMGSVPVP